MIAQVVDVEFLQTGAGEAVDAERESSRADPVETANGSDLGPAS
jgi:hypothetical protein